jgi:hypothetical protein
VKVTEADQAEYEAGMHRHFREKYAEALERITALEAENKRLREGWGNVRAILEILYWHLPCRNGWLVRFGNTRQPQ